MKQDVFYNSTMGTIEVAADKTMDAPTNRDEHACSDHDDKSCTGCLTGNPCPACLARINRTNPLVSTIKVHK
jgi:hypothetical protein